MLIRSLILILLAGAAQAAPATSSQNFSESLLERPNAFVLEALGRGGLYSLNFERSVGPTVSIGAGLSYWPESQQTREFGKTDSRVFTIPVYGNAYLYQQNRSKVFATGGITWAFAKGEGERVDSISGNGPIATLGLGYEYRTNEKKYLIRVTPQILVGEEISPWVGLSVGLLTS